MPAMFCRNCGTELPDGSKFCTNCGCSLTENSPACTYPSHYRQDRPPTYLALAIIVTILCCMPFGIVSIVYASKTDSYMASGDIGQAWENSRKARNWSVAGIVISLLWWVIYVILILVGISWATWWDNDIFYTTCML